MSNHRHTTRTLKLVDHEPEQCIKSFLRIKPESDLSQPPIIVQLSPQSVQVVPISFSSELQRVYQYRQVFGPQSPTEQVFKSTMIQPIRNSLSGFNSTVFIYGMTGAGKTYTMFNSSIDKGHPGLATLTLDHLFTSIKTQQQYHFQVFLSFFQIYNENIRDLLSDSRESLTILEDPTQGVRVAELKQASVNYTSTANQLILEGTDRRVKQSTQHNHTSSRSHAILQLTLRKHCSAQNTVQESKLFLVDLAGNERTAKSQSKRFTEGVNINKSLLTLGKCISNLSQQKKAFIPYRDSKLTRILKQALGGNSKTVMIACISPSSLHYQQTLNTLKFSSKAKLIHNKPKLNAKKPKEQSPCHASSETMQKTIVDFMNMIKTLSEEMIRVDSIKEELSACLQISKNQQKYETDSSASIKEVKRVLVRLGQRKKQISRQLQQQRINLTSRINFQIDQKIAGENILLRQQLKQHAISQQLKQTLESNVSSKEGNIHLKTTPHCLPQSLKHSSNSHTPNISIRIDSCKVHKQNIPQNRLRRSSTSQSSLSSQQLSRPNSQARVYQAVHDNIKIHPPITRDPILIRSDSVAECLPGGSSQVLRSRLMKMASKVDDISEKQVRVLLCEWQECGLQANSWQRSMLNKLRFVMKSQCQNRLRSNCSSRSKGKTKLRS